MNQEQEKINQSKERVWKAVLHEAGLRTDIEHLKLTELRDAVTRHCFSKEKTDHILGAIFGTKLAMSRIEQVYCRTSKEKYNNEKEIWESVWGVVQILSLFSLSTREVVCRQRNLQQNKEKWFERNAHRLICFFLPFLRSPYREKLAFHYLGITPYPYPVMSKYGIENDSLVYEDISSENFEKSVRESSRYLKHEPSEFLHGMNRTLSVSAYGMEVIRGTLLKDTTPSHMNTSGRIRDLHHWLLVILAASKKILKNRAETSSIWPKLADLAKADTKQHIDEICSNPFNSHKGSGELATEKKCYGNSL